MIGAVPPRSHTDLVGRHEELDRVVDALGWDDGGGGAVLLGGDAGIGKTGKHEYHIINNNSGSFMTYPDNAPQGKQLTGNVMSPSNDRTRWSIIPLRNGSGQYW